MKYGKKSIFVQEDVVGEASIMASFHHANLLPLLASFTDGDMLWMIEPYVSHGSVLNIMKYHPQYKEGLPEDDIKVIMFEMLKGLEYLHRNGMIHRDVKAGNILVDSVCSFRGPACCKLRGFSSEHHARFSIRVFVR